MINYTCCKQAFDNVKSIRLVVINKTKLNKMKHYIQEIQKEQCDIHVVKHFYFKVNNSKIKYEKIFDRQVNKVIERIKSKHNILNEDITIKTGILEDDFIYNRFRLRISVNCA